MLRRMEHRGPDGEGLWSDDRWVLGHRRLAIVDLTAAGRQPMTTDDGLLVCTVNGEIYNYAELRRTLEGEGARFRSNSDSEVVLHAYRAWGTASFERLNGMFAFALYDAAHKRLYLVRDRLGIKPLYYVDRPELFLFASEIKPLMDAWPEAGWSIDPTGLSQYLTYQNLLGGQSLFTGVRSLQSGHFLLVERDNVEERAYWTPSFDHVRSDLEFGDAVKEFRATLTAAVDRHLMSDVPVASYLSAGYDSTTVATEAARLARSPPHTFTGRFRQGGWYDEGIGARMVAEKIGSSLVEVQIDAPDFAAHFDDVVYALDEPRMGIGALPQYLVARKAAEEFKVILTGHGGDELFSGYVVFKLAFHADQIARRDPAIFACLRALRASEMPHIAYFVMRSLRSGRVPGDFLPILFSAATQQGALQADVWRAVRQQRAFAPLETIAKQARSNYERILLTYLKVYLPGLLVVEDNISMAHSLESRTPLLDNAMVDLSLSMPDAVKLHAGHLKAVVKEAASGKLPSELFKLPKRGFPTPLAAWLRGPLAGWMRDRLCSPNGPLTRLFRREYLELQTAAYLKSWSRVWRPLDEVPTHRMWMLLNLESWLRQIEERHGVVLSVR